MKLQLSSVLLLITFTAMGQPALKPGIGIGGLPSDNAPICFIPYYTGSFAASGYQKGDTVPDFTLYDLSGQSINLGNKLANKKPVLLIAGNYTCPVYRDKVASINYIQATYGNQVQVFVIYGVEAHPLIDTSPYFARVNTHQENYNDSVLFRQPTSYGLRKSIVQTMIGETGVTAPVFLDGPCNEWWLHYGPAPNNAYLIDTNGIVYAKHDWYNKLPNNNIEKDVRSILGLPPTGAGPSIGKFNLTVRDSVGKGIAGDVIDAVLVLTNNDTSDVLIDMARTQQNLPATWLSSMCTDICYPTDDSRDTILLAANDSITFYMHFYTSPSFFPDSGNVLMGFRNINKLANSYQIRLFCVAAPSGTVGIDRIANDGGFHIFPNPFKNIVELKGAGESPLIEIFSLTGKLLYSSEPDPAKIDLGFLAPGMYYLCLDNNTTEEWKKIVKVE